jgi:hypothetical protein
MRGLRPIDRPRAPHPNGERERVVLVATLCRKLIGTCSRFLSKHEIVLVDRPGSVTTTIRLPLQAIWAGTPEIILKGHYISLVDFNFGEVKHHDLTFLGSDIGEFLIARNRDAGGFDRRIG